MGVRKLKTDIDILVNCAGVAHYSPLVATSAAAVEKTVQTNLLGTMLGCRMVGRNMMKMRQGERSLIGKSICGSLQRGLMRGRLYY